MVKILSDNSGTELQKSGISKILLRKSLLFLRENICCDPSLEPSRRDGSNERSQYMFKWGNKKKIPKIPFLQIRI